MKKYASRFLKTVGWAYIFYPVGFLALATIVFDIPASRLVAILLMPFFYFVSLWAIVAGFGLKEMKRWGWYIFLIANLFIVYQSAYVAATFGETHHKFPAFLLCLFSIALLVFRVTRELRVPYFLPRIRWWESNAKYQLALPVLIVLEGPESEKEAPGSATQGRILDISLKGCFIKTSGNFSADSSVRLRFRVFGQMIECDGRVVWATESRVTHPKGIGIKFDRLGSKLRRRLRVSLKRLEHVSALYRRPGHEKSGEEVLKILKELEAPVYDFPAEAHAGPHGHA